MKMRRDVAIVTLVLLTTCFATQATTLAWFGNSFSDAGKAYSQVPTMINCHTCGVTEAPAMTLTLTPYITPSCWLSCQEAAGAFAEIDSAHFNYVVAQDNVANFMVYDDANGKKGLADELTNWATHTKNAGGTLVIEQMWLRVAQTTPDVEWTQNNQNISDKWYDSVAHAAGSILSPNGHAWFYAYQIHPEYQYTDPQWNDMMHPGTFGAYLNACCFFAAMTGVSPVGHTIHKIEFVGDSVTIPDSQAVFAQQQAWAAYQYFKVGTGVANRQALNSSRGEVTGRSALRLTTKGKLTVSRFLYGAEAAQSFDLRGQSLGRTNIVMASF